MKMFKKFLLAFLFAAALFNVTAASAAVVNLNLTDTVQVGSTFTVEVWANELFAGLQTDEEFLAFGMSVANNSPELFSFTGVTIATPFADDSALLTLDAAGSAFPGMSNQPDNQSMLLASLTFFANSAGNGTLGVRSDLTDPNQGLIFFKNGAMSLNADLNVNVSAVPLPAALPLLLSGMGLLVGVARHRNKF